MAAGSDASPELSKALAPEDERVKEATPFFFLLETQMVHAWLMGKSA